ncbi:MAG: aminopeptidase [Acidobacteriia bacterium]|nr:aminopeptidase [Terriglobia bacterium]
MAKAFDLERFLVDVFAPEAGERVAVMVDVPTSSCPDDSDWGDRRRMAEEWRAGLERLGRRIGFEVLPLVSYPATGSNGASLPANAELGGKSVPMASLFDGVTLVLALTEFSATAPLIDVSKRRPGADVFRAASMPGIMKRMEETSLAADYGEVARRCRILKEAFLTADRAEVEFSTGHRCLFDLRFRVCESDDGYLHRDKSDDLPVINLPSGETFEVPYEGEKPGIPSRTEGELPVGEGGETVVFRVLGNRIVEVIGAGPAAERHRAYFATDPARGNIAELAFGCNERAVVTGNVLEDEKAGFHWAFGRSDHLGGVWGVEAFLSPQTVVHQDIVYAQGNPIGIARADLVAADGKRITVIRDGAYVLW